MLKSRRLNYWKYFGIVVPSHEFCGPPVVKEGLKKGRRNAAPSPISPNESCPDLSDRGLESILDPLSGLLDDGMIKTILDLDTLTQKSELVEIVDIALQSVDIDLISGIYFATVKGR